MNMTITSTAKTTAAAATTAAATESYGRVWPLYEIFSRNVVLNL
jgi:hypothetical protein